MAHSKVCFKCGVEKKLDQFYRHPRMADGHLSKCKECAKNDVHEHRSANLEKIRAYDRERGKNAERMKHTAEVTKAWREQDKRRMKCHNTVARALKNGEMERKPCERCGAEKSLAHHEDYDKPLEVMWLCQVCHKQRHKELES